MAKIAGGIAIFLLMLATGLWTRHGLQLRAELTELRAKYSELQALTSTKSGCMNEEEKQVGVLCWDGETSRMHYFDPDSGNVRGTDHER